MSMIQSPIFRRLILPLALIGLTLSASAGGPGSERQLQRMIDQLELSDSQQAEIQALVETHQDRMGELGLDPETRREGRAERHALMQEIMAVLTPEQRQTWMAGREARQAHRRQRGRQGMRRALEGLDLSDEQRTQIEALVEAGRERGREEREAFMQELQQILTPEQWATFESQREAHRGRGRHRRG